MFPEKFVEYCNKEYVVGNSGEQHLLGANSASTDNNLKIIARLFNKIEPLQTLEIGLCHGISAALFTSLHEESGSGGSHVAVDPYQTEGWDRAGLNALEQCGLNKYIEFHEDFSSQVLANFVSDNRRFDLIYIDGSHLFEDVFVDFYFCQRLLNPGGVILFDDGSTYDVSRVLKFIDRNFTHSLKRIDLSKYLTMSPLKRLAYPAAARLYKVQLAGYEKITLDHDRHWSSKTLKF